MNVLDNHVLALEGRDLFGWILKKCTLPLLVSPLISYPSLKPQRDAVSLNLESQMADIVHCPPQSSL